MTASRPKCPTARSAPAHARLRAKLESASARCNRSAGDIAISCASYAAWTDGIVSDSSGTVSLFESLNHALDDRFQFLRGLGVRLGHDDGPSAVTALLDARIEGNLAE